MTTTTPYQIEKLRSAVDEFVGELLVKHDERRDVDDFARYRGSEGDSLEERVAKAVAFMKHELGFTPWSKQIEVIEAFLSARRTAVRGCHGAGKDALLAGLMLFAAYVLKMLVVAISATEKQLLVQLWREVANRFSARLPGELYTADLRIGGQKRIVATTSGSVSSLTGYHDANGVFIAISEAQGEQVEAAAFDAALSNAVDDASRIVVVGNPVKPLGRFYEVSRKPTWRAIQISAFDHPNVVEGRVVIPGGPAPSWPAEMAAEFGTSSPWYISRVLGEFPSDGSVDSLVKVSWLEAAYARHHATYLESPPPVAALDVARSYDRDESVAAIAQGPRVIGLHTWRLRDLVATTERFLGVVDREHEKWSAMRLRHGLALYPSRGASFTTSPPFALLVDAPGIGSGVCDELTRLKRPATEYWGWNPSSDDKRWANLRAEVYWNFRTLLESGKAALPRDLLLHEEALAMEWSQDARGRIMMVGKEELRQTLKRSPDRLDAAAMSLWAATRPPPAAWGSSRFTV